MNIIATLRQEESRLKEQLSAVQNAIAALDGGSHGGIRRKGKLSAAGRARIAAAARARWAKVRARKAQKAKKSK